MQSAHKARGPIGEPAPTRGLVQRAGREWRFGWNGGKNRSWAESLETKSRYRRMIGIGRVPCKDFLPHLP